MKRYLLDTNHLGNALDEHGPVQTRLRKALQLGARCGTCVPALCEALVGIRQTARREKNERMLDRLVSELRIWPVDLSLVASFADIRADLKSRGRHFSQIDIMIAAIARQQKAILLTSDRDFEALPDLACENWIASSA